MAEILQLFSITRRLYKPDVLPLAQLQLESSMKRLKERYKFAGAMLAGGLQVIVSAGEFLAEGSSTPVPIQQVAFSSNAIDVQLLGETNAAEQLQHDLANFLAEVSGRQEISFPEYARSVQTVAIVRLDVPVEALFSEKLSRYVAQAAAPAFKLEDAESHVQLAHLQWVVSYTRSATDYSYEPKLFTIEPRFGSRPSDRVYYTQSPTDSDTHRRLLDQFEEMLR